MIEILIILVAREEDKDNDQLEMQSYKQSHSIFKYDR